MNPGHVQIAAAVTFVLGIIGFLIANRGVIGGAFANVFARAANVTTTGTVVDDDALDFQALRRLQKRFAGKPDTTTALKTLASAFIEG